MSQKQKWAFFQLQDTYTNHAAEHNLEPGKWVNPECVQEQTE
jgi:hypothetical protein